MKKRMLLFVLAALACSSAHAKVYTWVDDSGVRHYTDVAQNQGAKQADLSKLQSVESNGSALKFASQLETEQNATNDKKENKEKTEQPNKRPE